ncbi:retrovirus-related pol polyprotein from transposon TNT 1-94 [Tanacetum coccineum]
MDGVNILKSIDEGPIQMGTFRETLTEGNEGALHLGPERARVYSDLSPEDKERYNADIRETNILLQGLPKDIYTLINHYTDAKDIWDNVKMLLEGSELTKEDCESQLYDDFEHFRAAGYGGAQNRVGNANPSQAKQIKYYNCNGIGHIARNCTQPKWPQNSEYFKDKMLLMQAQENGVALDEEQLLFLAGGQDNAVDKDVDEQSVYDLALNVDNVFQADDCDAFDSDVDEAPTAQTIFMANLSSADPVYDEASPSYDSDILSEVHDHDHYQDAVCEHHEVHEMHDDVQPNYVVDSHADYTSDSNMIPYDQYVKDNAVPVVQSNVSFVPNDAYMMILNDIYEPSQNNVVDNSLTAELATYKEQVELYKRRAKFELTEREQKIDEQLRIVITDRNRKEESLKRELHSVKLQLTSTINHNKSMVEEVTSLKKDFKQKENKYLEEFLDMKALKEKVEDKLYKQDQSLQTVHMLCKPKPYYDKQNKVAIGYKNPLCLTRAQQVQPALYNGHEIIKTNHVQAIVHNTEDTLEIAEMTRKKMNDKMKDPECVNHKVKIAPPDYSKENYLATFTPQKQLTPEQIFWSQDLIKMKAEALKKQTTASRPIKALTVYPPNTPATLVPRMLPTKSRTDHPLVFGLRLFKTYDGGSLTTQEFREKFIRIVRFGNDHFGAIMGYGDYVIGDSVISRNGVVERRNRTLVEAARTMLIFSKAPMFLWAEAVATACYTQNRSLIHTRHNKTPYELVHDKKPDLTFFRVFGALCYPTNNSEDLRKLQPTADIGIFVSYAPSRKGYKIYNKRTRRIMETIHVLFDELSEPMAPVQLSTGPAPTFLTPGQITPIPVNSAGTSLSTTIDQDAPSLSHSPSYSALQSPSIHQGVAAESTLVEENPFAPVDNDPFINILASKPTSKASSFGDVSYVTQTLHHLGKWSKDHPLDNVIGNPSRPVSTRKQLATDALWCFYNSILSKVEPKNFKSAITEDCWFQAMQDEIHEFDRLQVWELVPQPDCVMIIALKWIYKVKLDEYGDVLKNKARLVAKGYRQEEGIDFEESFAPSRL